MRASGRNTEYERPASFGFTRFQTVRSDIKSIVVVQDLIKIWSAVGEIKYLYGSDSPETKILAMALGRDWLDGLNSM